VVSFTTDTEVIQERLAFTRSKGKTALLDAVYLAMNETKKKAQPSQGCSDHL